MDMHPERFALSGLVEELEAIFLPLTVEKRLDFTIRLDPSVPAEIFTDKQRLRQILHNLLSNAVKFTERGGVEARISAAAGSNGRAALRDRRHRHRHRRGESQFRSSARSTKAMALPPPLRRDRPWTRDLP